MILALKLAGVIILLGFIFALALTILTVIIKALLGIK
jgi:hypothetical protein